MAVGAKGKRGRTKARGAARRRRLPRFAIPLAVAVAVGFLYWKPATSYLETRDQLDTRRGEVEALRAEKARLDRRLARAASLDELARDARRIGYVRPGEQLFIVKGTAAWQRRHARGEG